MLLKALVTPTFPDHHKDPGPLEDQDHPGVNLVCVQPDLSLHRLPMVALLFKLELELELQLEWGSESDKL